MGTYVYEINDDQGQLHQGFEDVANMMHSYYQHLLGLCSTARSPISHQVIALGNTLAVEQLLNLCAPFFDKDVEATMFSIPTFKSPGPDGFNSGFYKATWHITGKLVHDALQQFFKSGHMPSSLGQTKMVLPPKIPNPTHEKDFRPISCCSVLYKCITKLLCNRLKEVFPHLIHQQ